MTTVCQNDLNYQYCRCLMDSCCQNDYTQNQNHKIHQITICLRSISLPLRIVTLPSICCHCQSCCLKLLGPQIHPNQTAVNRRCLQISHRSSNRPCQHCYQLCPVARRRAADDDAAQINQLLTCLYDDQQICISCCPVTSDCRVPDHCSDQIRLLRSPTACCCCCQTQAVCVPRANGTRRRPVTQPLSPAQTPTVAVNLAPSCHAVKSDQNHRPDQLVPNCLNCRIAVVPAVPRQSHRAIQGWTILGCRGGSGKCRSQRHCRGSQ